MNRLSGIEFFTATEARQRFGEILSRVKYQGMRAVVTLNGKPHAALISIDELRRLEDYEKVQEAEKDQNGGKE